MLYIVSALYEEALPFLKKYNLKRKTDFPHFELFTGEKVLLLVTRPGAMRAAVALSSVLTAFPPAKDDVLLSVGCAGCAVESMLGRAFLINRITEASSGRTRYPELLYRCPFPEAEVITQSRIQVEAPSNQQTPPAEPDSLQDTDLEIYSNPVSSAAPPGLAREFTSPLPVLYDMEAAGVYEAAIPYFSCDRLFFLKVVSDTLTGLLELPEAQRRAQVTDYIAGIMPELVGWLDHFLPSAAASCPAIPLGTDGTILFTEICSALHLSVASSRQLYQLMLYLALSGIPFTDSMREFLAAPLVVPCQTKKEGLKYLEQLIKSYL